MVEGPWGLAATAMLTTVPSIVLRRRHLVLVWVAEELLLLRLAKIMRLWSHTATIVIAVVIELLLLLLWWHSLILSHLLLHLTRAILLATSTVHRLGAAATILGLFIGQAESPEQVVQSAHSISGVLLLLVGTHGVPFSPLWASGGIVALLMTD